MYVCMYTHTHTHNRYIPLGNTTIPVESGCTGDADKVRCYVCSYVCSLYLPVFLPMCVPMCVPCVFLCVPMCSNVCSLCVPDEGGCSSDSDKVRSSWVYYVKGTVIVTNVKGTVIIANVKGTVIIVHHNYYTSDSDRVCV